MYKCNVYNKIFDEPISESAESFYGVSDLFSYSCGEKVYMCPYCNETWFEEYREEEEEEEEEEGMHVRTKNNGICKLYREFHEDSVDVGIGVFPEIDGFFIDEEEIDYIEKKDVLKASYNIIDLIETGDYVNGNKVIRIETSSYPEDKNVKIIVCCGDDDYYSYYNEDIKTILTKEQFDSMKYEVDSNE